MCSRSNTGVVRKRVGWRRRTLFRLLHQRLGREDEPQDSRDAKGNQAPHEEQGGAVLVKVLTQGEVEDRHPSREKRAEQHDDLAGASLGKEQRSRKQHEEDEDGGEVAGSCRLRSGFRVESVLREVQREEKNRKQRR